MVIRRHIGGLCLDCLCVLSLFGFLEFGLVGFLVYCSFGVGDEFSDLFYGGFS